MSPLSPEAEKLIARTRGLDEPSLDDQARLRARLDQSWARAAGGPAGLVTRSKFWLGGFAIVTLATLGMFAALRARPSETPRPQSLAARAPDLEIQQPSAADTARQQGSATPRRPAVTNTPTADPRPNEKARRPTGPARARSQRPASTPSAATRAADEQRSHPTLTPAEAATPAPEADPRPAPAPSRERGGKISQRPVQLVETERPPIAPDAIAAEVALLGAAQEALQAGRPSRALTLVQQHAFRFPDGALAQERLAVHTLALCALQRRAAASQVFDELQHRVQSAPVIARIRRDCGF